MVAPRTWALLAHECRLLRQNRFACVAILTALVAAFLYRQAGPRLEAMVEGGCTVVYWQEDDWVRALRSAAEEARRAEPPLTIDIVPVADLTVEDGAIRYPRGTHSIQLRPPARAGGEWLVWYWYEGRDAEALWPYARWFWKATRDHFGGGPPLAERVSPLRPHLALPGGGPAVDVQSAFEAGRIEATLVWLLLFYCGCHLPALSLAEERTAHTLDALVLSPAGWRGVLRARQTFYLGLAVGTAAAAVAILAPAALLRPATWALLLAGAIVYLGAGLLIGAWSHSVTAASGGVMAYVLLAGVVWAVALSVGGRCIPAEAALLEGLGHALADGEVGSTLTLTRSAAPVAALAVWAVVWHVAGTLSFRGLQRA